MHHALDEKLGHDVGVSFVSPFQGLLSFLLANPGRCPGLVCCSPFGAVECGALVGLLAIMALVTR